MRAHPISQPAQQFGDTGPFTSLLRPSPPPACIPFLAGRRQDHRLRAGTAAGTAPRPGGRPSPAACPLLPNRSAGRHVSTGAESGSGGLGRGSGLMTHTGCCTGPVESRRSSALGATEETPGGQRGCAEEAGGPQPRHWSKVRAGGAARLCLYLPLPEPRSGELNVPPPQPLPPPDLSIWGDPEPEVGAGAHRKTCQGSGRCSGSPEHTQRHTHTDPHTHRHTHTEISTSHLG